MARWMNIVFILTHSFDSYHIVLMFEFIFLMRNHWPSIHYLYAVTAFNNLCWYLCKAFFALVIFLSSMGRQKMFMLCPKLFHFQIHQTSFTNKWWLIFDISLIQDSFFSRLSIHLLLWIFFRKFSFALD